MHETLYVLGVIGVTALVTWLTRAFPFLIFRKRELPDFVRYLGEALPPAIMVILVIYCLRGITPLTFPYGLPEIISAAVVVVLQAVKKNVYLSIILGTACYMILIRTLFAA